MDAFKVFMCMMIACNDTQKSEGHDTTGLYKGVRAVGFQYDSGAAWAIVCTKTPYGTVPGKLDGAGGAYYPWGWKEHRCVDWDTIHGELVFFKHELPENCKPKAHQTNDDSDYYNAVVVSDHGMIPGKAKISGDLKTAWYSWGGQEFPVNDNFYFVC